MTDQVTILTVQDSQRCTKIINYSLSTGDNIYQCVENLIKELNTGQWDLNDETIAITIADAIYNYLP